MIVENRRVYVYGTERAETTPFLNLLSHLGKDIAYSILAFVCLVRQIG